MLCWFLPCVHVCKSLQSCLTPRNTMDCSPLISSVHGILQARIWKQIYIYTHQSGLPFPSLGDLPQSQGSNSHLLQAGRFFTAKPPGKHPVSAIQQRESAVSIHVPPPSGNSFPSSTPSHPSRLLQSTVLNFPCYRAISYQLSVLHIVIVYVSMLFFQFILPSPSPIHKSVLYLCVSIPVLQIGSSIPFFQIPYMCINT